MTHSFNSILLFDILIRAEFNQTLIINTILGYILSYLFEYSTVNIQIETHPNIEALGFYLNRIYRKKILTHGRYGQKIRHFCIFGLN